MEQNNSILGYLESLEQKFWTFSCKLQYDVLFCLFLVEIKPNMSILHWYKGNNTVITITVDDVNRKCNKNCKCNNLFFFRKRQKK